ncbi:contractile injection system protein, VgrG/Pvc8 family [Roseomonas chloroacetimidivorans]|uniref:contractile injection system protein, VgrG/Pvc8 family n=1 Tax=Roseomonas chloroacetimidivorans TaxID=1766656 RepID=UPI003C72DA65
MDAPALRHPRVAAKVNGVRLDGQLKSIRVQTNRYRQADAFALTLRMDDAKDAAARTSVLADSMELAVEILAGDPEPTVLLIEGRVDDVELDVGRQEVRLTGRDRTADLLDTRTAEKWPNRTASEIATELAVKHGLTPRVTRTKKRSGTYYEREYSRLETEVSEWSLLVFLAEQEGFDVYVRGRDLHFGPPLKESEAPRWVLDYRALIKGQAYPEAPVGNFILRRSLTVARDVEVRVVSWNASLGRAITASSKADRSYRRSRPSSQLPTQVYVVRKPGLTEEQASVEAQQVLEAVTRHEKAVDIEGVPADVRLTPEHLLILQGTGTAFDQAYRLDAIDWSYDAGGFDMRLRCRNVAPESSVAL